VPKIRFTIQIKLSAIIVAVVLGVVCLLVAAFTVNDIRTLEQGLGEKARTYAQLVARDGRSAVAFDDRQTAREVFEAISVDGDVVGVALFGANGLLLESRGEVQNLPPRQPAPPALAMDRTSGLIRVLTPVISDEGPRGALILDLSTEAVSLAQKRAIGLAVRWGSAAVALGLLAAWFIARSFARRLSALAGAAASVAAGNLDRHRISDPSSDEIGQLVVAFNTMWSKLKDLLDHIQQSAREEAARLDGLVKARTAELDHRNAEMRLVLDHVDQGLVTLDARGVVGGERSRIADTWFGVPTEGMHAWEWLGGGSVERREAFEVSWDQVVEGVMPLDLCIDQLPAAWEAGERTFGLTYKPLLDGEALDRMLVVISNQTAQRERERVEREQIELGEIVARIQRDRASVVGFFAEARNMVDRFCEDSDEKTRARLLHTLKGNAAVMGLPGMSRVCHDIETALAEDAANLERSRALLHQTWTGVEQRFAALIGAAQGRFEVQEIEYDALSKAVDAQASHAELRALMQRIRCEPVEVRLGRLAEYATWFASRLGKGPLSVRIEGNGVRLPPTQLASFWSAAVHVIRNAVDHGLEDADARRALGKAGAAHMTLRVAALAQGIEVELRDSGAGIDWSKLERSARDKGLRCETPEQRIEALFAAGVSTKDEATELSGRGVGLGAVRAACREAGGTVVVTSQAGEGTSFCFRFPTVSAAAMPHPEPSVAA
jgi:two-component system chemotaxis sensor kinase CheA